MDCPICLEPDSHHVILGKPVDVHVWHLVWCGKGRVLKPSDAQIDWDLPPQLAPVKAKLMRSIPVPRSLKLVTGDDPWLRDRDDDGRFRPRS